MTSESRLGRAYQVLYDAVAGRGVSLRMWHFQWLGIYALRRDLKERLPSVRGRLLDIGCGSKPYSVFLDPSVQHVGVDVTAGPSVDLLIDGKYIPLPDSSTDVILCTQVLQLVEHRDVLCQEMVRCLKRGGALIVSVPFIYNEHGRSPDFWRFTKHGVLHLFRTPLDHHEVILEGGIGSSLGLLLLNWLESQLNAYALTRHVKGLLLPLYFFIAFTVNILGYLLDKLDRTGLFYNNLLLVGIKR